MAHFRPCAAAEVELLLGVFEIIRRVHGSIVANVCYPDKQFFACAHGKSLLGYIQQRGVA